MTRRRLRLSSSTVDTSPRLAQDEPSGFTLVATLAGTIELDSSSTPVFRAALDAEIAHVETTPAEGA